jgi:hypothetical protein
VTWGGARGHVGGARSALSEKVLTLDTSHAEIFALKADVTPLLPPHIEGGQKSLLICVTADTSQSAIGPYGVLGHTPPTGSTARHAATAAALLMFVMGVLHHPVITEPAGHVVHAAVDALVYRPAAHAVQLVAPPDDSVLVTEPAGQTEHVAVDTLLY